MKDLLLIKKIQANYEREEIFPVTFDLDDNFHKSLAIDIFNKLQKNSIVESDRFIIKKNSFTIDIKTLNITKVIEEILSKNLSIYGIYTLYDNYIEGEEKNG